MIRRTTGALLIAAVSMAHGFVASAQDESPAQVPPREQILATLVAAHPRLLIDPDAWEQAKTAITADERLTAWHQRLIAQADRVLAEPASEYVIPDGKRLLATSRRVVARAQVLAYAHRMTGEHAYLDRAWLELSAAAAFKDWNPTHFLDTAEMTAAFAIAYDWLFDAWTDEQRATLRQAIILHGLTPAQRSYRGEENYGWWVKAHHNWNQVCNGGIALGALAIADEEPALAAEVLHAGLESLPLAMRGFAPDGGWAEGPAYWNYATSYNVLHLAALQTALGSDFGFCRSPGFARTGEFPALISAPSGRTFNYADGRDTPIRAPQLFWLARRFEQPDFAAFQSGTDSPSPLDVLWAAGSSLPDGMHALPLDRHFEGIGVVTMRSAWNDPDAIFVGLKGGSNAVNHSHLELGSFVLESGGVRWAIDLGGDDYNMPAYFGNQRWTYYRLRSEGQNTIVLAPGESPEQDPKAAAPITETRFEPAEAWAAVDLSAAYAPALAGGTHTRRIGLVEGRSHVVVEDRIEPGAGSGDIPAWWFMHTKAAVEIDPSGRIATLAQDGRRLSAEIAEPDGAVFTVMDAHPLPTSPNPEMQNANEGVRKLAIQLTLTGPATLRVILKPQPREEPPGEPQ